MWYAFQIMHIQCAHCVFIFLPYLFLSCGSSWYLHRKSQYFYLFLHFETSKISPPPRPLNSGPYVMEDEHYSHLVELFLNMPEPRRATFRQSLQNLRISESRLIWACDINDKYQENREVRCGGADWPGGVRIGLPGLFASLYLSIYLFNLFIYLPVSQYIYLFICHFWKYVFRICSISWIWISARTGCPVPIISINNFLNHLSVPVFAIQHLIDTSHPHDDAKVRLEGSEKSYAMKEMLVQPRPHLTPPPLSSRMDVSAGRDAAGVAAIDREVSLLQEWASLHIFVIF